jgi:hypothetical protein
MKDCYDLIISIAGLGSEITCSNEKLSHMIQEFYYPFITNGPIHSHIRLVWEPSRNNIGSHTPQQRLEQDIFNYVDGQMSVTLDINTWQASIKISSATPMIDTDYAIRLLYSIFLFHSGGYLAHGVGIIRNNEGYLFVGRSGSGKSTIARLSCHEEVLSDDLVALVGRNKGWSIYSTPFSQVKMELNSNQGVRCKSLFFIKQGSCAKVESIPVSMAVAEMITNLPIINSIPKYIPELLDRCEKCFHTLSYYRLYFSLDRNFWDVIDHLENP